MIKRVMYVAFTGCSLIAHRRRAYALSPWLSSLLKRWPLNLAVIALANKMRVPPERLRRKGARTDSTMLRQRRSRSTQTRRWSPKIAQADLILK